MMHKLFFLELSRCFKKKSPHEKKQKIGTIDPEFKILGQKESPSKVVLEKYFNLLTFALFHEKK